MGLGEYGEHFMSRPRRPVFEDNFKHAAVAVAEKGGHGGLRVSHAV